jgi:hypothetical protein
MIIPNLFGLLPKCPSSSLVTVYNRNWGFSAMILFEIRDLNIPSLQIIDVWNVWRHCLIE